MYVGVDGCSTGWIAVQFDGDGYEDANLYEDIQELWMVHGDTADIDRRSNRSPGKLKREAPV